MKIGYFWLNKFSVFNYPYSLFLIVLLTLTNSYSRPPLATVRAMFE